jgi:hypothetical protein
MQTINLTQILDPGNPARCTVVVPDDVALARVPEKGRGSLARWLAKLPNGTRIEGVYPSRGRNSAAFLVKVNGHFVDEAEVA